MLLTLMQHLAGLSVCFSASVCARATQTTCACACVCVCSVFYPCRLPDAASCDVCVAPAGLVDIGTCTDSAPMTCVDCDTGEFRGGGVTCTLRMWAMHRVCECGAMPITAPIPTLCLTADVCKCVCVGGGGAMLCFPEDLFVFVGVCLHVSLCGRGSLRYSA
jgi:hypothetical protein